MNIATVLTSKGSHWQFGSARVTLLIVLIAMLMTAVVAAQLVDPARNAALAAAQDQDARVAGIAYRLQTKAGRLCPAPVPLTGMVLHHLAQYDQGFQRSAATIYGLGNYPRVLAVVPGSAADRAGIQAGDEIRTAGGVEIVTTGNQTAGYAVLDQAETQIEIASKSSNPTITIARNRLVMTISLRTEPGCASRVQVIAGRGRNAQADGKFVQITAAIIGETTNDSELAFVIAHELAHNVLGHRALLDTRGRGRRMVYETEMAADRLGIALMKAAGYDPYAAAHFWDRFGRKTGAGIFSDGTHMRTKARVIFLRAIAADVVGKSQKSDEVLSAPPTTQ